MDGRGGDDAKPGRSLTYVIVGMVVGLLFLLLACALIGWNYFVVPVPKGLVIVAIALGALSATAILVSVAVYTLTGKQKR